MSYNVFISSPFNCMQLHSEAGKGQFEIVLGYTDCGRAANNLIITHEVAKGVARKHGLLASFTPRIRIQEKDYFAIFWVTVYLSLFNLGERKMEPDYSWIYQWNNDNRIDIREEFIKGVKRFVEHVKTLDVWSRFGAICCPCVRCDGINLLKEEFVKEHLYRMGFHEDFLRLRAIDGDVG
ncbi:uncharacterized protein LOC124895546 isoform X2 [Capsicum annuum]|uniref:uncharacterized protein LOC124895546 isoform X2 n=1 Tax=Capsicum annuum TaxID=4072 RepID=UPI001FB148FB|nr:uncharacterized protein LOC124895546 isoform X2 [Capsicum annuum]